MVDFDPAKEAIDRSKHHVSLARWIDLEVAPPLLIIGSTMASHGFGLTDISMAWRTDPAIEETDLTP